MSRAAPVLKAPFPWFGGKATVSPLVWDRFGAVRNFVDPFFGSGAMLLGRPTPFEGVETINDADGFVSNFWRALAADPDAVAHAAFWPVNENDLHARHAWLVGKRDSITSRLEGDPDWFDARVAGWWAWGLSCWIGSGWCSGKGPWQVVEDEDGVRKLVHVGDAGRGVNRKRVHVGDAGQGVNRRLVHVGDAGRGVNRRRVHVGDAGQEEATPGEVSTASAEALHDYLSALSDRLRKVRVCCGDFARVLGPSVTIKHGLTAVFLDPPYAAEADREADLYSVDCGKVAHRAREWALANGDDPLMRVALCGYDEHAMPPGWDRVEWKARGGYGSQGDGRGRANAGREVIWFNPHCLKPEADRFPLFASLEGAPL